MGELRDLIHRSLSESADKAVIDTMLDKYSIDDIDSPEKAVDFTIKNDVFKRGLDSLTHDRVKNHDERFKAEKLPEILKAEKERIMNELNPPKTEKDEALSQVRTELAEIRLDNLRKDLIIKKAEYGLPKDMSIERYVLLGQDGFEMMKADAEIINSHIESKTKELTEAQIKDRFKGVDVPKQSSEENIKTMERAEFARMRPDQQMKFTKDGGQIV